MWAREQWEYCIVENVDEEILNSLGKNGWELVGILASSCYLKRSLPDFREQVTIDQKRRYYAEWQVDPGEDES